MLSVAVDPQFSACYLKWPLVDITRMLSSLKSCTNSIRQILWLTGEMIKGKVRDSERLVFALLKQVKGGDHSADNIWLVEAILSVLIENR